MKTAEFWCKGTENRRQLMFVRHEGNFVVAHLGLLLELDFEVVLVSSMSLHLGTVERLWKREDEQMEPERGVRTERRLRRTSMWSAQVSGDSTAK